MQFYETIEAVQSAYLAKAKATESPTQAVKIGGKIQASSTGTKAFSYAACCPMEVTAKVANKYIKNGKVQDEAPILITSDTGDFLGGTKKVYAFTTPGLGEDNLKPTSIVSGGLLKTWSTVTFKANHNFMVKSEPVTVAMFRSTIDGALYVENELPEQDQSKCLAKYSSEVKAERNARISDTDSYIQVSDMTVQAKAKAKREQLTDDDKEAIKTYRQALRDLPEVEGFPFVQFPKLPSCVAYECQQKIDSRNSQGGLQ